MTKSVLASLLLATVATHARAAPPPVVAPPKTSGASLVLLIVKIDRYDAVLKITVNDLPLVKTENFEYPRDGGNPFIRVPELLLHKGTNTIHIAFAERNPKPVHEFDVSLAELSSFAPQTVKQTLHHVAPPITDLAAHPLALDYTFEVTGNLPRWSYETGKLITQDAATEAKLKAAAVALGKTWTRTKRVTGLFGEQLRNGPDDNVTNLGRWVAHPKLSLDLRDQQASLEVFDHGHLAHLVWGTILPWRFVGGAHDAPDGELGPVDIDLDIWFRLDARGAFVPVAVWQTGVAPDHL